HSEGIVVRKRRSYSSGPSADSEAGPSRQRTRLRPFSWAVTLPPGAAPVPTARTPTESGRLADATRNGESKGERCVCPARKVVAVGVPVPPPPQGPSTY